MRDATVHKTSSGISRKLSGAGTVASFDKDEFYQADFNVNTFLATTRQRVNLPILKKELQIHLNFLAKELVDLINEDYADFVNLSATLVGMDKTISVIREPLSLARDDILKVKNDYENSMQELQEKLDERTSIIQKKVLLQTFLNISNSITKIEAYLHLNDENIKPTNKNIKRKQKTELHSDQPQKEEEGSSLISERVVSEFNQLQFYVSQCGNLPYIDSVRPRIEVITQTLLGSLSAKFEHSIRAKKNYSVEQCLRTYAILGKVSDAEKLFAKIVCIPYMEKNITPVMLKEKGLPALYSDLLRFVKEEIYYILEMTHKPGLRSFHFLTNSVWAVFVDFVAGNIANVYSPGIPSVFHKNYMTTTNFIDEFECFYGNIGEVKVFRASKSYSDFMSRWSISIYFQLRYQEIASVFEDALTIKENQKEESKFLLTVTEQLWDCANLVWSTEVILFPLIHRFWKLYFQLFSRFDSWISKLLLAHEEGKNVKLNTSYCIFFMSDLSTLIDHVPILNDKVVSQIKSVMSTTSTKSIEKLILQDNQITEDLNKRIPSFLNIMLGSLIKECKDGLKSMYSVASSFRGQTKEMPTGESDFAPEILNPLKKLLQKHKKDLPDNISKKICIEVLRDVTIRYNEIIREVLVGVENTEKSLLALRKIRKNVKAGVSDEDRIRCQIYLNIQYHKKEIEQLGLSVDELPEFKILQAAQPVISNNNE